MLYWPQVIGGALIGVAAVAMLALHGRVAGVSGMLSRLVVPDSAWPGRLAFIAGLTGAPQLFILGGLPAVHVAPIGTVTLLAAGGLVGIGTVVGNGCTSGHGVCGIARLSKRSIVATITFMASAIATVFVMRHL